MEQTITDEEIENIFERFLNEYLGNVVIKLPQSFRAQQLKNSQFEARLVSKFESDFLKEPFMKALKLISSKKDSECEKRLDKYNDDLIKDLKEMGFNSLANIDFKLKNKDAEIRKLEGFCKENNIFHNQIWLTLGEPITTFGILNIIPKIRELKEELNKEITAGFDVGERNVDLQSNLDEKMKESDRALIRANSYLNEISEKDKQLQNSIPKSKIKDVIFLCTRGDTGDINKERFEKELKL